MIDGPSHVVLIGALFSRGHDYNRLFRSVLPSIGQLVMLELKKCEIANFETPCVSVCLEGGAVKRRVW